MDGAGRVLVVETGGPGRGDLVRTLTEAGYTATARTTAWALRSPACETQIALSSLLERAPNLRLAVRPDALRWRKHVFLRGLRELPVAF